MLENRFYKVAQEGGSYVIGYFFNPITGEGKTCCVRDYDYDDCSRDNDELYYMPIDQEVRKIWLHNGGNILEGDRARVVKGRTIEHGFIGTVEKIKDYYDKYHRYVATYIYFDDGRKINMANCELVLN